MSKFDREEDLEFIRRFRDGEGPAFDALVRKYQKKVYYFAFRLARNHQDADDLAQETFIRTYNSLGAFKGGSAFFTWLYRITINLYINSYRKKIRQNQILAGETEFTYQGLDALSMVQDKELGKKIGAAAAKLPPRQQVAFNLRYIEELTFEEVAESMGCSVGAAKASCFQAVRKMRGYLKSER